MRDDRFAATLGSSERRVTVAAVALGVVGTTVVGLVLTVRSGEPAWLFLSLPLALILFVTNRESLVWLDTDRGWVGLSPDQPDEFVERLRARVTRARDG